MSQQTSTEPSKADLLQPTRDAMKDLFNKTPDLRRAFIRLAFYDAILRNPIDASNRAKGSIRLNDNVEQDAVKKLDALKAKNFSYADIYQLAGIEAIKSLTGNMDFKFEHGRPDYYHAIPTEEVDLLLAALEGKNIQNLKAIFNRLGFSTKEMVALCSAIIYLWTDPAVFKQQQQEVDLSSIYGTLIHEFKPETPKGQSQDINASKGSASNASASNVATRLSNWKWLVSDPSFCKHVEFFDKNHDEFLKTYKIAHEKLSNIGLPKFVPVQEYHDMKHGIAFAMVMTILFGVVGFFYETMRS